MPEVRAVTETAMEGEVPAVIDADPGLTNTGPHNAPTTE